MEQLNISDLYDVIGGSDSFNDGRTFGKIVGENVKDSISSAFDYVKALFTKEVTHGYNSSGYRGGITQGGSSHSSGGRYL